MTDAAVDGCAILVVEDEYLLAKDLCAELAKNGAAIVGPASTVEQGFALISSAKGLNGAVLDVNLQGTPVFDLADELAARQVPFVFTTGYDASAIPERFRHVPRCEKPLRMANVLKAISRIALR